MGTFSQPNEGIVDRAFINIILGKFFFILNPLITGSSRLRVVTLLLYLIVLSLSSNLQLILEIFVYLCI